MLNSNYTYCFLDFETTGLSLKDDVIQVGLVVTDAKLQIISYFSSFVNPGYEIDALKTIVSYTTGITPEQIMSGMSLDNLKNKLIELIPENAIFVGHNIGFDLKFLKKYLNGYQLPVVGYQSENGSNSKLEARSSKQFIDTLDRAKALIHYPASYSLDILYPFLREQLGSDYFISIMKQFGQDDIRNHDALSDCVICMGLIQYCLQKVESICISFPITKKIIQKSDFWFLDAKYIDLIQGDALSDKVPLLDFPNKPITASINDSLIDRSGIKDGEKIYYGDLPIEQVIRRCSGLKKSIIATNSKQKLNIIKSKCKVMGLYDIGFMREQQQVDKTKLNRVYTKDDLEGREVWFFLKYCSHKLQGLGLLDLNTTGDYKIYNYIRENTQQSKASTILATHSGLFSILEQAELQDYSILFLDNEWRYTSYLKYLSTPRDPINFSRIIDNFLYEYTNDNLQDCISVAQMFMNTVDVFCGVLFMEIDHYIHQKKPDGQGKYEIEVISGNQNFPKTNALFARILSQLDQMRLVLPSSDATIISKQFEKMHTYLESICQVTPVVSDYTSFSFTLGSNFVDYSEFSQLFKDRHHFFFSNRNQTFRPLTDELHEPRPVKLKTQEITDIKDLQGIVLQQKVFVLNNNPIKAKKLFEYLQTGKWAKDYKVLVENVTGGRGKNIAISKTQESFIMIGGYEMALQCIAEKTMPAQLIVYEQQGLLHQQIIADLKYRADTLMP